MTQKSSLKITNLTRGTILADKCVLARDFASRGKGLMRHPGLKVGEGLLLYPEWSIHTFFMRFPIDVLFVNKQHEVIGLRIAMRPNLLYAGAWGAQYVIELPEGVILASQTALSDLLEVTPPL